ncbi:transmembrane protein 184C-like [Nicotiana tabacum]|uniref:DUF300 family protein n=1 Tax=Nicotiana tabacum TaxID=4097 RepID=D6R096_TOBAC|nr:transmembrane protein 184C-like [Nicotiana tabacum]XP_016450363.1 PREDICTED: transmembrane protein 184C-like [Nicotiana tabacum]XP_016450364.1 PREDICTED: transmembrane protein 184C-like [Nicotiana tabacum]XP_016450365.1 PREDICTED: transmembrane protein 184C-like [Nicotiana tabacum]XP_016450366.1 PREDICTED: transmembrane protein 184C-like [Nicotiana tabacum]XP_016450367.1 PREDICTED: transmembrane protein 184C-like [Nicotiana tabacum]ADG37658.1 DUF300 family protein [Nicotiana tabacum]
MELDLGQITLIGSTDWLATKMELDRGKVTLIGSTICLMLTMHFSIQLVTEHFMSWKKPKEQKAIIIIVLMAPLYAIDSFIGLIDFMGSKPFFTFLDSVKECYEAIVMAKFLALMYTYLNISISKNIVPDEIKGRQIHHSFPMTLFQPHTAHLNHHTLKLLKNWTWQFVVIRPVCSILMIALQLLGVYPSWVSWTFTMILNISVSLALYSLVIFYHVFAKELAPHKPLAKFLCVKGIVFFVFWQGILLEILVSLGIIRSQHFWLDVEHIQEGIQNVLVIVEMVFFAIFMRHAYSAAPYRQEAVTSSGDKKKE